MRALRVRSPCAISPCDLAPRQVSGVSARRHADYGHAPTIDLALRTYGAPSDARRRLELVFLDADHFRTWMLGLQVRDLILISLDLALISPLI